MDASTHPQPCPYHPAWLVQPPAVVCPVCDHIEAQRDRIPRIDNAALDDLIERLHAGPRAFMVDAACAGVVEHSLFFPERGASVKEAKAICHDCPVRLQCLEYALDNNEKFGIWGGLSERERRRIRAHRCRTGTA